MGESNMYLRKGCWYLRARVGGLHFRETLHTSNVRTARRLRDKRMKEIESDVLHGERRVTWQEAVVQWIRHTRGQIAPLSLKRYSSSLRTMEPYLIGLTVDKINGRTVNAMIAERRGAGAKVSTCKRDLSALASVLTYAVALGQREGNPALDVSRTLKERHEPIRLPTDDAIAAVTEAAGPCFGALITGARLTGARQAELCALRWSNFSEAAGTLEIEAGKGNRRRVLRLSPEALAHVAGLARRGEWIFCDAGENQFTNVAYHFHQHRKHALRRVTFTSFRFHDLRHLFAVEALRGGMGLYRLQRHLGHASIKMTENYLAFLPADDAEAAKAA
jgi:integrase/recombinase XerD